MAVGDTMGNIERWHIYVCAEHGIRKPKTARLCPRCDQLGRTVEMERVEVVRALAAEGAVEALREIAEYEWGDSDHGAAGLLRLKARSALARVGGQ